MRQLLLTLLLAPTILAAAHTGFAQKPQPQCEQGPNQPRNWELLGHDYVYFDYVLCAPDLNPPKPLVSVWITTGGIGIGVEKWAKDRDGVDRVSRFNGKKKAYTLYRDLNAIPLSVFKAESRSRVPAEVASQPFLVEGTNLIPFENLTADSAERAKKVFESADLIIRAAQRKVGLLFVSDKIGTIVNALETALKAQK